MLRRRLVYSLILLALLVSLPVPSARAKPDAEYVATTGQWLADPFLDVWRSTPNVLRTIGYPLSAPFLQMSEERGRYLRVQYFERAVLEEHVDAGGTTEVLGRLLGNELALSRRTEVPFRPAKQQPKAHWDAVTSHNIAATPAPFRAFWEANGGLQVFGRPISEQFEEAGEDGVPRWVQYFERQRMEWHPDLASSGFAVQLGRLGDEHRRRHPEQVDSRAFAPRSPELSPLDRIEFGINTALFYADRDRALELVRGAGLGWVRQQIHWKDHQSSDRTIVWGELDSIVGAAERRGIKLLLSVTQAPDWATGIPGVSGLPDQEHLDSYAAFVGALAHRYRGRVQAYEIWNEINLAPENSEQAVPPPDYYVELLMRAYRSIKANDPGAIVVSTPLAPTEWRGDQRLAVSDVTYARALFADERFWRFQDYVGVHVFGCANPPDSMWPERPGSGPGWVDSREFYFRRVEDIRQAMVDAGHGERQVWITEFGWATTNDTPGHEFGNRVSFEQQAEYLVAALQMGDTEYTPWVAAMFVWNLNFSVAWQGAGTPLHQMASYSIVNGDWSPRPAYRKIGEWTTGHAYR